MQIGIGQGDAGQLAAASDCDVALKDREIAGRGAFDFDPAVLIDINVFQRGAAGDVNVAAIDREFVDRAAVGVNFSAFDREVVGRAAVDRYGRVFFD